ncbi:MAG: hypothetical protein JW863_20485 [Chitinispirillaceae bacterium]|nr:hypothetical protein [Chitinispirillaceae bacterium]
MRNNLAKLAVLLFLTAVAAQSVKLSGKISNDSDQAVTGAVVELVKLGLKDTTGADGMYAFDQTVDVNRPGSLRKSCTMIVGSMLRIRLNVSGTIEVRMYDLHGNMLKRSSIPNATAGFHTCNLDEGAAPPCGMRIIHASIGDETLIFRYLAMGSRGASGSSMTKAVSIVEAPLSKAAADVDSLRVTAAGYAVKTVGLSSCSGTVNVTLQTGDRWGGLKNPPIKSAGCGKPQGITSGKKTIRSGGRDREYIIDIPTNYDPNTAHRFFYVSHWINGNADAMAKNNYYGLKTEANKAKIPAVFVAASGLNGSWGQVDHALFDDILAYAENNLCIDITRVFAIGYSFGGMYTYSLSTNHQDKIRACVGIAPANYNIWLPNPKLKEPIAWMQIHGLQDETCRWINNASRNEGGKYIALEKARNNGCDIPGDDDFPVWQSGPHFCYEFEGCDEGYPVRICTNNGTHSGAEKYKDPGASSTWVPPESREFFMQF